MNAQFGTGTWRGMAATLAAGAVSLALSTGALAWSGQVEGRPASFQPGAAGGYYVWRTDTETPHWHVETTDRPGFNHLYTGTLTTDGQFTGVNVTQPEGDDWIQQIGPGTIQYHFHTYSGRDGVRFDIVGGSQLTLALGRDGQPIGRDRIYLGAAAEHPASNPFTLVR